MNFMKYPTKNDISISNAVLKLAKLQNAERLELTAATGAVIVTSGRMTAKELLSTVPPRTMKNLLLLNSRMSPLNWKTRNRSRRMRHLPSLRFQTMRHSFPASRFWKAMPRPMRKKMLVRMPMR